MSVNTLSVQDCIFAVHQAINSPNFTPQNPHLTLAEAALLRQNPPVWPINKPVFSPYITTHDNYSQIRYNNTKYLIHRISYRSFYGNIIPPNHDVSHTLFLGDRTARYVICNFNEHPKAQLTTYGIRNINPRFLCLESNILNRSRLLCHIYMEQQIWWWETGLVPRGWAEVDFYQYIHNNMNMCRAVHGTMPCTCSLEYWT